MIASGKLPEKYRRVALIANPAAGSTNTGLVSAVEATCRAHAGRVDVLWTHRCGHATELARRCAATNGNDRCRPDVVVSIGGDGTLREVVIGLIDPANGGSPPPLLVLPGGTGNSNYRSLWDDVPWYEAVTAALTGEGAEQRMLDLARIVDPPRLVVLGASTGLFAEATAKATSVPVTGRARYQAAIASVTPSYVPYVGQVVVDGTVVHQGATVLVSVGGSRHRAGVFEVLPHSVRDDGLLDVCVVGAETPVADTPDLMRRGAHLGRDGVVYARGRSVTLHQVNGHPLLFEHDGEVLPSRASSFTIEVVPRALPVLASHRRPGG